MGEDVTSSVELLSCFALGLGFSLSKSESGTYVKFKKSGFNRFKTYDECKVTWYSKTDDVTGLKKRRLALVQGWDKDQGNKPCTNSHTWT